MSAIAIQVEQLGKQYRIGGQPERYKALRDVVANTISRSVRSARSRLRQDGAPNGSQQTFWALRDLSFEIPRGHVVGIIGRNGAGKSTLLKILSRITEPTQGWVDLYGRVGSLLEVGTGFHPELTGRENIYLNGAILGMRKQEVERKFDEIVSFAEVEKFIDTPVKHYSSGMYLRLAFAVAAHLEPEILLVDEVLAVGDAAFQQKCIGKMVDVAQEGRTVLFVSHNMAAVSTLCRSAIVLDQGRVVLHASTSEAIHRYSHLQQTTSEANVSAHGVRVTYLRVLSDEADTLDPSADAVVQLGLLIGEPLTDLKILLVLRDAAQNLLLHQMKNWRDLVGACDAGDYRITTTLPPLWLADGVYTLYVKTIAERPGTTVRQVSDPVLVNVRHADMDAYEKQGIFAPRSLWSVERQ
jgi:lipopolysaccharide transport system ATP-binding protein